MKKLFTSALLAAVAVPFLIAAPAARKTQNSAAQSVPASKPARKHVRKSKAAKTAAQSNAVPASSSPVK